MDIEILIEIDKFPPYNHSPFDPYLDIISVCKETYIKIMSLLEKMLFLKARNFFAFILLHSMVVIVP